MNGVFKEFRKLYGESQFFVFFAMYHGIKKAMDFWVPKDSFGSFDALCKKYNILYLTDIKFVPVENIEGLKEKVIGGNQLTSTKMVGEKVESDAKGSIHVLISMNEDHLNDIFKFAWYPTIRQNRVVNKSMQDIQDFGNALGYPYCCRKFFFEKNNWQKFSFLYEIYKKSEVFDYRCNCFWKDNPTGQDLSYIYHMPCNFGCEETIEYAKKIEEKLVESGEEELLEKCKHHLHLPCLVIRELKIYAFEGEVNSRKNTITYSQYFFLGHKKEVPEELNKYIKKGNMIQVTDERFIDVFKKRGSSQTHLYRYDCLHQSEIEIPFIVKFT